MKDILVLSYCVSPSRGSEFSVAWNYITHMSKNNRLTVLFGCGGEHLGDFDEMAEYLANSQLDNVKFVPVYPNKLAQKLNWLNRRGVFAYSFYLAYNVWHKQVYKAAKDITLREHFDVVHYLNPIGYREPGYLWKLGLPYMWGPINGADNYPWVLFKNLSFKGKLKYGFHNLANSIQLYSNRRIKYAINTADIVLAATTRNQIIFERVYNAHCIYLPENCLTAPAKLDETKFDEIKSRINLIFIGTLDYRKNVVMALQAISKVKSINKLHLDIIGDGSLLLQLESAAKEYGLKDIVTFHGKLPREEAVSKFSKAHLNIITSLGEGNPTTIWEAMSYGVPTLTLDHCGMHDTVKDLTGYKVPLSNSYDDMVNGLVTILNHIVANPEELIEKARSVVDDSKQYQWSERVAFFEQCYEDCINKHYHL